MEVIKFNYSYEYCINKEVYISSDNPHLNLSDNFDILPRNIISIIESKLCGSLNDRSKCSLECRGSIYKAGSMNEKLLYRFSYPRYGTCRKSCKRLLRIDNGDFQIEKFTLLSSNHIRRQSIIS